MIRGIIYIIIGIALIVTVFELRTNVDNVVPQMQQGYRICNSPLGHIGSAIFGSVAERCAIANQAPDIILILEFMVGFFEGWQLSL
jgi:hypothetical protein